MAVNRDQPKAIVGKDKRAEEALRLTQFSIDRAGDAVFWLDRDSRLVYANKAACDLLGYSRKELYALSIADIDSDACPEIFDRALRRVKRRGSSTFEACYRTKAGAIVPVEVSIHYLKYGDKELMTCYSRDITERKRAEEMLRESGKRTRAILDNVADCVIVSDDKGRIEAFNPAAERVFGYAEAEVLGRNVRMLMPEPERRRYAGYIRNYLKTGKGKVLGVGPRAVAGRRKDGSTVPVELAFSQTFVDGKRMLIATMRDITERIRLEKGLAESEARLRAVVDHSPTKIHIKDLDGRYLLVNRRSELLFGVTEDEAKGKTTDEIFPKHIAKSFKAHDRKVAKTGQPIQEEETWRQDDGIHTYLTVKFPIPDADGNTVAVGAIGTDITERKQAEQALSESHERFKNFADAASDWFWEMGPDLRFTYHSDRYFEITGFRPKDKIGTTRKRYVDPINLQADAEKWDAHMADLQAHRAFKKFEYSFKVRDDSHRHARISGIPVFDQDGTFLGYRGTGTDITAEVEALQALRAAGGKNEMILNAAGEGIYGLDMEGRTTFINPAAARMIGWPPEELIGEPQHAILHHTKPDGSPYPKEECPIYAAFRDGTEHHVSDEVFWRQDGTSFPVEYTSTPIRNDSGELSGAVVVFKDITERKQAEEALIASEHALQERVTELEEAQRKLEGQGADLVRLTEDLTVARDHAEAANRAKSEFLATMSHELRTPLNAIIGFSDIMRSETFGPVGNSQYLDYLGDINDSGQHLLDLICDILDLSKIESGEGELNEESIDVAEVVESVLRLVQARAVQGRVEVVPDLPDSPPLLRADQRKLKQILVNLLTNAIKFSDAGGMVTLKAWCHPDSGYVFQIVDNGIGIALEDIPKALAPFRQLDGDLDRKYEGTGLGLPLTKSLVELHGGSLDLQSQVGVGTTVTVRFPAERIVQVLDHTPTSARRWRAAG